MRGYCAIGIEHTKTEANVGTLWRSALAFDAAFVFTVGHRYHRQASDCAAWRHLPLFHFDTLDDLRGHLPHDARLVGVEDDGRAKPLVNYRHPERAVYLLGAEDHGLTVRAWEQCEEVVSISSRSCLNVASAGSIVLYDRAAKRAE